MGRDDDSIGTPKRRRHSMQLARNSLSFRQRRGEKVRLLGSWDSLNPR
ncbi:uncharacterized protein G2W53_000317 [Senna tora]|uniref:Uncharacterized protein n=1 Tax=Senna tora TaxID=362788 RepID=A0A834XFM4_9FABA|nr:uncharacterized protein G2W53_000317 [Senna tora]